jgi:hypothetical protein
MFGTTYKYIIFLYVKIFTPQYMCTWLIYKKNLICRLTRNGEAPLGRNVVAARVLGDSTDPQDVHWQRIAWDRKIELKKI